MARQKTLPKWHQHNLARHTDKHRKCFADLLRVPTGQLTQTQYKDRAEQVVVYWLSVNLIFLARVSVG